MAQIAGESTATQDWSRAELGPQETWPQALQLALDIMLNTPLPMLLMWSRRQIMLYNQAYASNVGTASAAPPGGNVPAVPPSAWSWNAQAIEQAWSGQSLVFTRQPLKLWRDGHMLEAAFDLHYTPLRGADGAVAGILCTLAPASAPALPAAAANDGHLRILVVEDNQDAQFLVCEMLRAFGHEVSAAASAEGALELLAGAEYDVLFSDVSLPGMSGVELGRTALQRQPRLRIIFATGYSQTLTSQLDFPAITMQKPYDIEQLQQILRDLH
ncbi:response regulator [Pseudoduganella violaceinigra]|uniref:response regulator n=1 Tax=Pseudoduganella violaceinigra TaxID=246602 RepID=UPI00041B61D6|nr:response regulator [Pseudoduganella violaceinigra]